MYKKTNSDTQWFNVFFYFYFLFVCDRCAKWVQNSRREDHCNKSAKELHTLRLCSDHFELSRFTTTEKKRLMWDAVPTLFAVPNPPRQLTRKRPPPKIREHITTDLNTKRRRKGS